ncbi:hypothetical protein G6F24_016287 [Rhizopus arrhizus]|nr:hypothetical protein G6F24_016287 [Rhizopus arrhizus]
MLPARAFELLAGAAVYLCPVVLRSSLRPVTLLVGAILIIACALLVTESLAWPGYLAGIPVLGTALVIMAACDAKVFQLAPALPFRLWWRACHIGMLNVDLEQNLNALGGHWGITSR